jgi:hypothetical protein
MARIMSGGRAENKPIMLALWPRSCSLIMFTGIIIANEMIPRKAENINRYMFFW